MLIDDFEDGDIDGWQQYASGSCVGGVSAVAATGSYSMMIIGECGYSGSFYYDFGSFNATSISLNIMPGSEVSSDALVKLGDYSPGFTNNAIIFFASSAGKWLLNQPMGMPILCGDYNRDQWYNVVFTLNWNTKQVGVAIDGVTCTTDAEFFDHDTASLNRIILGNYQDSYSRYDDILMSVDPPQPPIFIDGFETGDTSMWSNTVS
jgi:hypothetical protein